MLSQAARRTSEAGYVYIGMDHFALPDDALAIAKRQGRLHRNFQGYSTQPDCDLVGLGVSAIGRVGATYSQNAKTLDEYCDLLDQGRCRWCAAWRCRATTCAARGDHGADVPGPAAFHLGRIASYAVAGAIAAASVDSLAQASTHVAALRPLWVLLHVFVFAWGAMLAATGRQPLWAQRVGHRLEARLRPLAGGTWLGVLATGMLWVALPCGLLYSALMLASLGNGPLQGAGLMALFALGSGLSLLLGPWLWQRLRWSGGSSGGARQAWGARLAGVLLAVVAAQALWSDLIRQIDAWCR
jgi:sulfite exporter TauE/SafE